MHNASSYWFLAERHTVTDEVIRTFDPKERFNQRVDFVAPATLAEATV
jgi:sarcosine oxidase subunit delta